MSNKSIYKITIINFLKHNPKSKKSFTHLMLSKSYFSDYKIAQLTPHESLLFIYLLTICADFAHDSITISTQSLPNSLRIRTTSLRNALVRFQQIQLLTFEKIDSLYNRIEEKRIEEKRIEVNRGSNVRNKIDLENNRKVWSAYLASYLERYKVEPTRNAKVNSLVSQLVKRVGPEEAILLVQFYLSHNKQFYISKMHDLSACVLDAEALVTQRLRGKAVLDKDIKEFVQQAGFNELIEASKKGGF